MTPELLAGLAAIAWGSAGLGAGVLSRERPPLVVALLAQLAGGVLLLAVALAVAEPLTARAAVVGAAGGAISSIGLVWLYRALSGPSVGLAAPIAASGILIPVAAGVLAGDALGTAQLAGGAVLVAGLALVLRVGRGGVPDAATARLAAGAAVSFGCFYLALDAGAAESATWVTAFARAGAVTALGLQVARTGALAGLRPGGWLSATALAGTADALGNLAYASATATGRLSVVSLLSAAYPAVSVALAIVLLRERVSPLRLGGVLATVVGLGLIAL